MIKGPEYYVRFVNYTFGDGFLLMAPTVILIIVIILLMIAVYAGTALYYRCRHKKVAEILVKEANVRREQELHMRWAKIEEQRKEIRRLQYEVNKWREAFAVAQLQISRVDELIHNSARIKIGHEGKKNA